MRTAALVYIIAFLMANSGNAQVARLEVHPVPSITISDSDFLAGRINGTPVILAGELRLPKSGTDKLPVVVLLHGSGGIGGVGGPIDEWTRELNAMGVATFTLDSFAGRGIITTSGNQGLLGRLNMVADSYRAMEVLAKHSRIDRDRIAVMGFSRGGQAELYSAMKRLHSTLGPRDGLQFSAHISFYPDCMTTYQADTDVSDKPIRVLHGGADDYNPITPCRAYVERVTKAGKNNAELIEFLDAHHVFDAPAFRTPVKAIAATTTRRCKLVEAEDHQIFNVETNKPFSFSDACVEKGPTIAYNEGASSRARVIVRALLTEVFKLK